MANASKSTLQNLLTALLAQANQDQNFSLPPYVYTSMFNTVTSFLINECVRLYTSSPEVVDIIDPFVKVSQCVPANGVIPLPPDYRNLLGSPSINVKGDLTGECGDAPPIKTIQEFQVQMLKGGCLRRPISIVSQSEFDILSTSKYKKPNYDNPIAYFIGSKKLKVCPFDVSMVSVMYVINEPNFNYQYIVQPDDSYVQDVANSTESIWGSTAFAPLLRGLSVLYGAYSRDKQFSDFAVLLNESNIVSL